MSTKEIEFYKLDKLFIEVPVGNHTVQTYDSDNQPLDYKTLNASSTTQVQTSTIYTIKDGNNVRYVAFDNQLYAVLSSIRDREVNDLRDDLSIARNNEKRYEFLYKQSLHDYNYLRESNFQRANHYPKVPILKRLYYAFLGTDIQ